MAARKQGAAQQEEVVVDVAIDEELKQQVEDLAGSFGVTMAEVAIKYPRIVTGVSWVYAIAIGALLALLIDMIAHALAIGVVMLTGSLVGGVVVYYGVLAGGVGYLVYDLWTGGRISQTINAISVGAGISTVGGIVHLKRKLFGRKEEQLVIGK